MTKLKTVAIIVSMLTDIQDMGTYLRSCGPTGPCSATARAWS